MKKLVSFMHVSLDGFAAGDNGDMSWIHVDPDIFEYAGKTTGESDMALYGRVTFQMMDAYWPTAADQPNASKHDIEHSHWYNRVPKVVISRTLDAAGLNNTSVISSNISEAISKLKEGDGRNIAVFGSPGTLHTLTQLDLVDEYWLFINPVILGSGIPVFKDIKERKKLSLVSGKMFDSGVVGLHYILDK